MKETKKGPLGGVNISRKTKKGGGERREKRKREEL